MYTQKVTIEEVLPAVNYDRSLAEKLRFDINSTIDRRGYYSFSDFKAWAVDIGFKHID